MEDKQIAAIVLGVVLLSAIGGLALVLGPSTTGEISSYQKLPHYGGVSDQPDPHTQYLVIDEGVCKRVIERYTTFLSWVDHACQELNHGRQKREADCRYQAELEAETKCRPAPVFANIRPPEFLTGMVPVDPLGCASLAENYDFVLQQTLENSEAPKQTIAMVNPCTGKAEPAQRQSLNAAGPLREYARTAFVSGDVSGYVTGETDKPGELRYTRCTLGKARVIVSGVPVCNTLD